MDKSKEQIAVLARRRMRAITREINGIARIARFMTPEQLEYYERLADEYKKLEEDLAVG